LGVAEMKVGGAEAVHILCGIDGQCHLDLVNMLRQRHLHDEAVDLLVLVELVDLRQQLGLGHAGVHADERRVEAYLGAVKHLAVHIGFAGAVVADEDGGQMGNLAPAGLDECDLVGDLRLDLLGSCLAVEYLHDERPASAMKNSGATICRCSAC
jgi:hypothetical protein